MATPHRVGALEIVENPEFQRKQWRVQRAGLTLMLLIIVLALAGLFGTGPLSSAERQAADGTLAIGYQRFIRHDGRSTLTIEADGRHAENGEIAIWVTESYFKAIELQGISPEPDEVRDDGDRRIMVFLVDDPASRITVTFSMRPQEMGVLSGEAGVVDGPAVAFDQFSYP